MSGWREMMTNLPPPYPLAWPEHQRRTATRVKSAFKVELATAQRNVLSSLRLFAQDTGTKAWGEAGVSTASGWERAKRILIAAAVLMESRK
jgi:hypothetical protein